jgi:hypothetical protein
MLPIAQQNLHFDEPSCERSQRRVAGEFDRTARYDEGLQDNVEIGGGIEDPAHVLEAMG